MLSAELAERLTAYEQIADQAARMKLYLEHVTVKEVATALRAQLASLKTLKVKLAAKLGLVAVMRKLIEAGNLVLARGQPWQKQPATKTWLLPRYAGGEGVPPPLLL